jgi:hypothetical protein
MRGLGFGGWAAHGFGRPQWQSRITIVPSLSPLQEIVY